jgi:hypothetical protein
LEKVLRNSGGDTRKSGREIKDIILPYVDALPSSIEKMHFIKKISDLSAIPQSALQDDLKKIEQELKYEKKEIEEAEESLSKVYKKDYILRKLLGIILWQKTVQKDAKEQSLDPDRILKEVAETLHSTEEEVMEKTKDNRSDLIFEAEVFYSDDTDIEKDAQELLFNLKEEYLKEELGRKMEELHRAEKEKDMEKSSKILKECQMLHTKIQDIKSRRSKNY